MKRLLAGLLLVAASFAAFGQGNFIIGPTLDGKFASGVRNAPTYVDARVLAAGVAETHTMPGATTAPRLVIFSSNCAAFYAKLGAAAAVPAADVTDGSGSELNPAAWIMPPGTAATVTVISPTICIVTMSVYLSR